MRIIILFLLASSLKPGFLPILPLWETSDWVRSALHNECRSLRKWLRSEDRTIAQDGSSGDRIGINPGLNFSAEEFLGKEAIPFCVSLPLEMPKGAIPSLKIYLDVLIATRPLPMDYFLESYSYDEKKGVLQITGRYRRGGKHTLFLGTFVWGRSVIALPSIEVTVTPLQKIFLSGRDILLPFPEFSLHETVENVKLRKDFAQESLLQVAKVLAGQRRFRDALAGILFLVVVSPALYFLMEKKIERWKRARQIISPKEELRQVKKSRDWTKLLALLQRLSGRQESLTSYELAAIFSREENPNLEKASLLIERHGYLQESDPLQFDEAIKQVKDFVGSMPS